MNVCLFFFSNCHVQSQLDSNLKVEQAATAQGGWAWEVDKEDDIYWNGNTKKDTYSVAFGSLEHDASGSN